MKSIPVGTTLTLEETVTEALLACKVGSGEVEVFATPSMIALMEKTASAAIRPFLDEGETSVGTAISTTHSAATPLGMRVRCTAAVAKTEGRAVFFEVEAFDEAGSIGKGTHSRFVLNKEKFEAKAKAKAGA